MSFSHKPRLHRVVKHPKYVPPTEGKAAESYENSGPGLLNPWLVMEEESSRWLHKQAAEAKQAKLKIIFSHPLLAKRVIFEEERDLFAHLFEEYDVYLWPVNEKENITSVRPIADDKEFFEKLSSAKEASAEEVTKILAAQPGVNVQEYLIWDHRTYHSAAKDRTYREFLEANALKRKPQDVQETLSFIGHNVWDFKKPDPDRKKIRLQAPNKEEIAHLKKFYPNADTWEIVGADQEWFERNLPELKDRHVKLVSPAWQNLVLNPQIKLKSLEVEEGRFTSILYRGAQIPELVLRSCNIISEWLIKQSDANHLKSLKTYNCVVRPFAYSDEPKQNSIPFEGLEEIVCPDKYMDGPFPASLKRAVLSSDNFSRVTGQLDFPKDFSHCTNLKELVYVGQAFTAEQIKQQLILPPEKEIEVTVVAPEKEMEYAEYDVTRDKINDPRAQRVILSLWQILYSELNDYPHIREVIIEDYEEYRSLQVNSQVECFSMRGVYVKNTLDLSGLINLKEFSYLPKVTNVPESQKEKKLENELKKLVLPETAPETLRVLQVDCANLKELDLSKFTQLEKIELINIKNKDFDLKLPENAPHLRCLRIQGLKKYRIVHLTQYPQLETFELDNCVYTALDYKDDNSYPIKQLKVTNRSFDFDNTNFPSLESLEYQPIVSNVNYRELIKLKKLILHSRLDPEGEGRTSVDCSYLNNLQEVTIHGGIRHDKSRMYGCINLHGCHSLRKLEFKHFLPHEVVGLRDCEQLREIIFDPQGIQIDPEKYQEEVLKIYQQLPEKVRANVQFKIISQVTSVEQKEEKLNTKPGQQQTQPPQKPLATLENLLANLHRPAKTVSCYEPSESDSPDADMSVVSFDHSNDSCTAVLENRHGKIVSNRVRTGLFDDIEIKNDKDKILDVKFVSSSTKRQKDLVPIKTIPWADQLSDECRAVVKSKEANFVTGYWEGKLTKSHELFFLPDIGPIENASDILMIATDPPMNILWDPKQQCCYIKSPPKNKNLRVIYLANECRQYAAKEEKLAVATEKSEKLMHPLLRKMLEKRLKPVLEQLEAQENGMPPTNEKKLERLVEYCKGFKKEKFAVQPVSTLDELCETILQQKGSCRHRSRAFMTLARLMNIPANMSRSAQHQVGEAPYIENGKIRYRLRDTGGSEAFDKTPDEKYKDPRETKLSPKSSTASMILAPILGPALIISRLMNTPSKQSPAQPTSNVKPILQQLQEEQFKKYYEEFEKMVAATMVNALDKLVKIIKKQPVKDENDKEEKKQLPPLIELKPDQDPLQLERLIFQNLNQPKNYLYIHSPKDFLKYLKPWRLENGKLVRNEKNGPLKEMLDKGGTLVVNWDNFTPTQIASYKSILDAEPTLKGLPIDKEKLHIIGMTKDIADKCASLNSRCKPYYLPADFFEKNKMTEKDSKAADTITIDLRGSSNWHSKVYGKIKYVKGKAVLTPSELIEKLQSNNPVKINFQNPPDSEDFKILCHRIEHHHRFMFNGAEVECHHDVSVKTERKPLEFKLPDYVKINAQEKRDKPRKRIYLHLNNLHEVYEHLVIDKKTNEANTQPGGFYEKFIPDEHVFYLTEDIPDVERAELMDEIQKIRTDKIIYFEKLKPADHKPEIYFTNDTDYVAEQKSNEVKDSIIIEVTPQTTFNELFARTRDEPFEYTETEIFKALQAGRTIILNGEMSRSLFQQLMPIFFEAQQNRHIHLNGERIPIQGNLMAVMPLAAKAKFREVQTAAIDVNYAQHFPVPEYKLIEQFYARMNELPHRGAGRPSPPKPSFHILGSMISALHHDEKTMHKHNPIKHLFHFDYPKASEEYAYANVMAKMIFRPDDDTNPRGEKIQKIMEKYHITTLEQMKEHQWRLLNCFNGKRIKELLQDYKAAQGFPSLTNFQKLCEHCHAAILQSKYLPPKVKTDRADKQQAEFDHLLQDKNSPILILKGPPGVGKSFLMREQKPYEGEKNIEEWLKNGGILFLDEINMAAPGKWNFLKGLFRKPPVINYNGQSYPVDPAKHKVVGTENPEDYPGRYFHPFLQHYAKTIYCKKPSDARLLKTVIHPMLDKDVNLVANLPEKLLFAYHLIEKYNPFLTSSYRDITSLCFRFKALLWEQRTILKTKIDSDVANNLVYQACVGEYAASIKNPIARKKFTDELRKHLEIKIKPSDEPALFKVGTKDITREHKYIVDAIDQDHLMRRYEKVLEQEEKARLEGSDEKKHKPEEVKRKQNCKSVILVEGSSGTGKSTLVKALADKEFGGDKKLTTVDDSDDVIRELCAAFDAGEEKLLDEYNLSEKLEGALNQLASGVSYEFEKWPAGKQAKEPGFRALATQNPANLAGRKALSAAAMDRIHFLYMDDFTRAQLINLSKAVFIVNPELFVDAFFKVLEQYPHAANMRTFFEMRNKHARKEPDLKDFQTKEEALSLEEKLTDDAIASYSCQEAMLSQKSLFPLSPEEKASVKELMAHNVYRLMYYKEYKKICQEFPKNSEEQNKAELGKRIPQLKIFNPDEPAPPAKHASRRV